MFEMYYAAPASRQIEIKWNGITLRKSPYANKMGFWSPTSPVIYLGKSIDVMKQYAAKAYYLRKTDARAWGIYLIYSDKDLWDVIPDYDWGIDDLFFTTIGICKEHIRYIQQYFIMKPDRVRKNK